MTAPTAADARVASWASVSAEARADLVTLLEARRLVRRCQSGGYAIDLGDGLPVWRPDRESVMRLLFGCPAV